MIPVAVVGLRFGARIARSLPPPFRLAAVCDLDPARTTGFGVAARDLDTILADPDIAAVGLFTAPAGRAALIRRVVRAGKHVMTTKPFGLDSAAAAEVLAEARALGRVVHLNSPAPVPPPDMVHIGRWVRGYELGRPVTADAQVWTSYREVADGSWYDDPDRCPVAPVLRIGVYLINDLVALLGPAATVQVMTSRLVTGRPTADNALLSIGFAGGAVASVRASFCVDDGRRFGSRLAIGYAGGTVVRESTVTNPVGDPVLSLVGPDGATATATVRGGSGDYRWDAFGDAIRTGHDPADHAAVLAGVRVIEAMARAERSGRTEAL